ASRPRAWQTFRKEQGQPSSSAANQASTSSASRRARGVRAPALLCRSSNAPSSTASISRFSGGSAAEGRKNCSGRIVSGTIPGASADPNAESIIGSGRMAYAVLVDDDDLSGHVLVPAATEHVASKLEPARAVRDDADARHLAGLQVGADIELGYFEAVVPIQRGDFQEDRDALLERDLARVVLEPLRRHVHDLFRPGRNGGRREAMPPGRHPDGSRTTRAVTLMIRFIAQLLSTAHSVSAKSSPPAFDWTERKPSPRYGFAASHGMGAFFGTECGAGSGNISPFAAWCGMWPVI